MYHLPHRVGLSDSPRHGCFHLPHPRCIFNSAFCIPSKLVEHNETPSENTATTFRLLHAEPSLSRITATCSAHKKTRTFNHHHRAIRNSREFCTPTERYPHTLQLYPVVKSDVALGPCIVTIDSAMLRLMEPHPRGGGSRGTIICCLTVFRMTPNDKKENPEKGARSWYE